MLFLMKLPAVGCSFGAYASLHGEFGLPGYWGSLVSWYPLWYIGFGELFYSVSRQFRLHGVQNVACDANRTCSLEGALST